MHYKEKRMYNVLKCVAATSYDYDFSVSIFQKIASDTLMDGKYQKYHFTKYNKKQ